jgi:hypothetical protein
MAQRGRPKLNGVAKLQRDLTVVWSYNELRRAGEKHAIAVASAASEVRRLYPGMKVSETEVKRVLAKYQPKGYSEVFTVTKLKHRFGGWVLVPDRSTHELTLENVLPQYLIRVRSVSASASAVVCPSSFPRRKACPDFLDPNIIFGLNRCWGPVRRAR